MRTSVMRAAAIALVFFAAPAFPDEHLLTRDTAQPRPSAAAAERQHHRDAVERVLASAEWVRAASALGAPKAERTRRFLSRVL